MGVIATLLLTTALAGVVGTGLGGLIGALLQKDSNRVVSLLLSFAGGVMLSVVCFDLIVESIETEAGLGTVIFSVALGVAVIYLLNWLIDRRTNPEVPHIDENHPKTADDLDELIHADHLQQHRTQRDSKFALFMAGIVMACAIALHNVPEGMTIGASYASNNGVMGSAALVLAILIGLHNIPEGMAVSVPLISGGMGRGKAVLITALSGAPTMVGALLGYLLGEIGPMGLALSLGFASGAMLYVVFGEILPQAFIMYRSKLPAFSAIAGMLLGLYIIFA
ncbi:MAG: ZIP family metal transporter [Ruminococcaceae bacterium]|nr:ZIP family metal transporter [Oscillospiraceae bacterium]